MNQIKCLRTFSWLKCDSFLVFQVKGTRIPTRYHWCGWLGNFEGEEIEPELAYVGTGLADLGLADARRRLRRHLKEAVVLGFGEATAKRNCSYGKRYSYIILHFNFLTKKCRIIFAYRRSRFRILLRMIPCSPRPVRCTHWPCSRSRSWSRFPRRPC